MAPPPALKPDDPSLLPSDDEDSDFELPAGGDDSDDSGSDSDDERPAKRARVAAPEEPVLTKAAVDDLWASFNSGADDDPYAATSSKAPTPAAPKPKKIKITVTYQFVGETVTQEKEVLEDSKEAQDWLAKQKALGLPTTPSSSSAPAAAAAPIASTSAIDALFGPDSSSADTPPVASTSTSTSAAPPASAESALAPAPAPKGAAGPKKKKGGGLGALAASLGKPAKLNTLEKSKLDWNKFVDKEDLSDSLTHARKDGYLDKQDFLGRTEQARRRLGRRTRRGGGGGRFEVQLR
ncbi:bucentaur or craniofacial development-domain-containing protein [Leucosporidium creatinivorum]|uniref:SWR1-complex protein 5 n=1 Tax=Leucosporidium creatinivorum TaxID=106004 RepID=A0A1Y2FJK9_9BASI|nr:bucentaur or craniofacial development-domain-containing protein [Leucosporidium creatinivorum]